MTAGEFFEQAREILSTNEGYIEMNVDLFIDDISRLLIDWEEQKPEEKTQ